MLHKILNIQNDRTKINNTYIVLRESNEALLQIHNCLTKYDVEVSQALANDGTVFRVDTGKKVGFAWDDAYQSKREIKIVFVDSGKKRYQIKDLSFDFRLGFPQESSFKIEGGQVTFWCQVVQEGNSKILLITEAKEKMRRFTIKHAPSNDLNKSRQLTVALNQIGVSFIANLRNRRMELFYLNLINVEMAIEEFKDRYDFQARIKFVNVDTNHTLKATYPVLLTTSNFEEIRDTDRSTLDVSFALFKSPSLNDVINTHLMQLINFCSNLEDASLRIFQTHATSNNFQD